MNLSNDERLTAWIDGELDAAEAEAFEAEVAADPELARSAEALRRARELVRRHGPVRAPEGFAARVMDAVEAEAVPRGSRWPWAALAAAAVATLVLWTAVQGTQPAEVAPAAAPETRTLEVGAGAEVVGVASRYTLTVADADALAAAGQRLAARDLVADGAVAAGPVVLTLDPDLAPEVMGELRAVGTLEAVGPGSVRTAPFEVVVDLVVAGGVP